MRTKKRFRAKLIYFYLFFKITSLLELLIREIVTNFSLPLSIFPLKCAEKHLFFMLSVLIVHILLLLFLPAVFLKSSVSACEKNFSQLRCFLLRCLRDNPLYAFVLINLRLGCFLFRCKGTTCFFPNPNSHRVERGVEWSIERGVVSSVLKIIDRWLYGSFYENLWPWWGDSTLSQIVKHSR